MKSDCKTTEARTAVDFCANLMAIHQRDAQARNIGLIQMQRQYAADLIQNETNLNQLLEVLSPEFGADVRILLEKISGKSKHLRN